MTVSALRPSETIGVYLDYLFDGLEGFVYSPSKDIETGEFFQSFFTWPVDRQFVIDHIIDQGAGRDVYIAPALFTGPAAHKDTFKCSNVLWTEFDGNFPSNWGDIPKPTLQVQSSDETHQHCYWRVDEPITDYLEIEALNRNLTYKLDADASSWDCTQVLRPPGTQNHKRNTPVFVSHKTSGQLPLGLFEPKYAGELAEVDVNSIPDVSDIVYRYAWPTEVSSLLRSKDLPVGERSTGLMRLGYYLAEMGLSDPEIFSVLRNADDRWGKFKDRTDRNQRLIDLIARVRQKYPVTEFQTDVIPVFGFESFLKHDIFVEWVIEGMLQEQGYLLLTGPSGVGKTQFSIRWMMNLALGKNWLGLKVMRPRKILFFSLEMGHADLKHFISIMAKDLEEEERTLLEENLVLVPHGEPIYLDDDTGRAQALSIIEAIQPDGVVFDSVGSTTTGSISDESTVKKIMDFNDRIRKSHGIFTWWIHHMRKAQSDNKKPNKLSDVYGNQYLVNRATSVYCLWPDRGKIQVIPLKKRLAPMEEPWMIGRFGNINFERTAHVTLADAPDTPAPKIDVSHLGFSDL